MTNQIRWKKRYWTMQTVYLEYAPEEANVDMIPCNGDIVECSDDNPTGG
jgi:hypothetical protein